MSTRFVGPLSFVSAPHEQSLQDADPNWQGWGGPAQPSYRGHSSGHTFEVHEQEDGSYTTWSGRRIKVKGNLCWVEVPSDRPSRLAAQVAYAARAEGLEPTGLLPGDDVKGWQEHPCLALNGVTLTFIPHWPETGGQKIRLEVKSGFRQGSIAHRRAVEAVWPRWKEALPELPSHPAAVRGW
jgi:hypothetical protein